MNPWHVRHDGAVADGAERPELLALCLELQLDLLLVALGPEAGVAARPSREARPRWDGETLDLTGMESDLEQSDGTSAATAHTDSTLSAIAETVDELLANQEVRRHPSVVARLLDVRASFSGRLGSRPRAAAVKLPVAAGAGGGVEPGHFLG
jgi:hypothetical protein